MPNGDELRKLVWEVATALLRDNRFVTVGTRNPTIYHYTDGIYKPDGESYIKRKIQENLKSKEEISTHLVNEVLGHVERSTFEDASIFEESSNPHLVLENGLLNLNTKQLEAFRPDYFSLAKMQVKYDPSIDYRNSLFWKFINEILSPEDVQGVQEELGAILRKEYLTKKFSIYLGGTDTGKTTLVSVFLAFLGHDNVSSVGIQQLASRDKFQIAELYGKMANIRDDLSKDVVTSVGKLKEITGRFQVQGERKFRDPFNFVNHAYLIFTCNFLPPIDEDDVAFFNRVIIRLFKKRFGGHEEADRELIHKLTTPEELSALLNFALEGLERMNMNGWNYTNTGSSDAVREEYKRKSDPVWAFATDRLDDSDSQAYVSKQHVYNAFKEYCEENNLPNPGKDFFYKHLGDKITVTSGRKEVNGKREHCFIGVKLLNAESPGHVGQSGQQRLAAEESVQGVQGSSHLTSGAEGADGSKRTGSNDQDMDNSSSINQVAEDKSQQVQVNLSISNDENGGHPGQLKVAKAREMLDSYRIAFSLDNFTYEIVNNDFLASSILEGSVDAIVTDPPYSLKMLHLWESLGQFGKRVLKPGGFLATYAGTFTWQEQKKALESSLAFRGIKEIQVLGIRDDGWNQNNVGIAKTKPVLIFQKEPVSQIPAFEITPSAMDKRFHEWGQPVSEFVQLVERFSKEGELIVDPFAGGGTTIQACIETKRNCVAYEIEKESFNTLKQRFVTYTGSGEKKNE